MKYYPMTVTAENVVLEGDYAGARAIGNVKLGAAYFFFKEKRKVYYIPYSDITQCFRRVHLVQTKMCCGKGNLGVENIVICKDGAELAQIQLPGERAGKILLEEIAQRAPHVQIGK